MGRKVHPRVLELWLMVHPRVWELGWKVHPRVLELGLTVHPSSKWTHYYLDAGGTDLLFQVLYLIVAKP